MNFVPAVAYHLCLILPAAFTQPRDHVLAEPCSVTAFCVGNNRSADASVVYAIVLGWPDGDVLRVSAPRTTQGTTMSLVGLDGSNLQYRYNTNRVTHQVSDLDSVDLESSWLEDLNSELTSALAGWWKIAKLSFPTQG